MRTSILSSATPLDMAKLARDWLGHGVVGFDVAGSENYALTQPAIRDALEACSQWGVPTTVHAGELPKGMVGNLEEALEMKVHRIGHGAGLCHGDALEQGIDRHLLASAAENDTVIEVCLTAICTSSRGCRRTPPIRYAECWMQDYACAFHVIT